MYLARDVPYIISGPSPRDCLTLHSVIGELADKEEVILIHDPHPSNQFFGTERPRYIGFLVPITSSYVKVLQSAKT